MRMTRSSPLRSIPSTSSTNGSVQENLPMSEDYAGSEKTDLTSCDREPIHVPGSIQPHGALIVLEEPEMKILQVSANTGELLGIAPDELLNQTWEQVLAPSDISFIKKQILPKLVEAIPHYLP